MTTKFFPLFFQNDLLLTPSGVQVVYIIVPIAMALLSTIATSVVPLPSKAARQLVLPRGTGTVHVLTSFVSLAART